MTEPLPMTSVTDAGGRLRVSSGTPWEELIGYSRAVRVGDVVQVTGTVALGAGGELVGEGDPYRQTVQALANVRAALRAAGAEMEHVVRTRIYVTDIGRWEEVGRAHAEVFGGIRPATTMVQVAALIDPRMLVEVEAEAVVAG
jgi:enamine deaminase RidA (YjgF/YER057c/UK114 family)